METRKGRIANGTLEGSRIYPAESTELSEPYDRPRAGLTGLVKLRETPQKLAIPARR